MSISKKHHFVPQFILRHFADHDEQIIVHRLSQDGSYKSAVRDLGHRNLGHSLFLPGRTPDHVTVERQMGEIEGAAAAVVEKHLRSTAHTVVGEDREVMGYFIALQWYRHRFLLEKIRSAVIESFASRGRENVITDDHFRKSGGLINIMASVLSPWGYRNDPQADPKDTWCDVWSGISGYSWRLFRPRRHALLVSDNLVCLSGLAKGYKAELPERWMRHGVGIGFENCRTITVPLAPKLGLIITNGSSDAGGISTADFNRMTIFNSREWVAHHPQWGTGRARLWAKFHRDLEFQKIISEIIDKGIVLPDVPDIPRPLFDIDPLLKARSSASGSNDGV